MITWRTRKGEKPLHEMSDLHIANALAWCVERDKDLYEVCEVSDHNGRPLREWVDIFTKELRSRFKCDKLPALKHEKVGRLDCWVPDTAPAYFGTGKTVLGWRVYREIISLKLKGKKAPRVYLTKAGGFDYTPKLGLLYTDLGVARVAADHHAARVVRVVTK